MATDVRVAHEHACSFVAMLNMFESFGVTTVDGKKSVVFTSLLFESLNANVTLVPTVAISCSLSLSDRYFRAVILASVAEASASLAYGPEYLVTLPDASGLLGGSP
jgi:ABC-type glycerol-3-phosphate transport system permease component